MSRAALLPAGPDPFLIAYWLRHYRNWSDEVDELRIQVCGQSDPKIRKYLRSVVKDTPKASVVFTGRIDHGAVIGQLIERTSASHVLLCEDDAFVRKPGAVDRAFRRIETGEADVVGCPRSSASPELISAATAQFGSFRVDSGETGPALWPCFLFARRDHLLDTDRNFGAWGAKAGEYVPGFNFVPTVEVAGDTFVWASIQLRAQGRRIHLEPEYRAQLEMLHAWSGVPWFHVGSLSSGYGSYFLSDMAPADLRSHREAIRNDLYDWNKRMSWWQRVVEAGNDLPELRSKYQAALAEYMAETGMDQAAVDAWKQGFSGLISWSET